MIYSSINYAQTALEISYGTLMSYTKFCYFYGTNQLILSFNQLTIEEQRAYTAAPNVGLRYQFLVDAYDSNGELIHTADSARNLVK